MLCEVFYLIPSTLVNRHVPLQLSPVRKAVATLLAAEALLRLLVPVLDVLLQRAVALVAACAVRAGEQLGEGVRSPWVRKNTHSRRALWRHMAAEEEGVRSTRSAGSLMLHQALPRRHSSAISPIAARSSPSGK